MDLYDGVMRAAAREDFLKQFFAQFGEECGMDADNFLSRSARLAAEDCFRNSLPKVEESVCEPGETRRLSHELVTSFLREIGSDSQSITSSISARRPSIDDVATVLRVYVEEEMKLDQHEEHRRPSLLNVSLALKEVIEDQLSPLSSIGDFGSSLPQFAHMDGFANSDDSGVVYSPHNLNAGSRSPNSRSPHSPRAASPLMSASGDKRRLYICPDCDKSFNNASNMTRHRRIHSGDKPYQCSHCSLAFGNSSNRRKHERTCKRKSGSPITIDDVS